MEMGSDALPLTSVAVPSTVAPSRNVMMPVGTPVAGATALTVAVNVTACPVVEGFGVEVRLVVEFPALTTWVKSREEAVRS